MNKNYHILFLAIIFIIIACLFFVYLSNSKRTNQLKVQKIDDRGLFVGEKNKSLAPPSYNQVVKNLEYEWDHIEIGDQYFKSEQYDLALDGYKKAYEVATPDGRVLIGQKMIDAYEKLGRYDNALATLQEIEEKYFKGDYGLKKANEIRARLLVAKNQSNQSQN